MICNHIVFANEIAKFVPTTVIEGRLDCPLERENRFFAVEVASPLYLRVPYESGGGRSFSASQGQFLVPTTFDFGKIHFDIRRLAIVLPL